MTKARIYGAMLNYLSEFLTGVSCRKI
jgi:hypothetical protein